LKKRILICKFHQETNTFSPIVNAITRFNNGDVFEGERIYNKQLTQKSTIAGAVDAIQAAGIEVIPTVFMHSGSGGRVADEALTHFCNRLQHYLKTEMYDGVYIEDSLYLLGHYRVTYADGKVAELPVKYGENITSMYFEDYLHSSAYREVSYSTRPVRYRDGFAYETVYENPNPDGTVVKIEYVPAAGKEDISVQLLGFSLARGIQSVKNGQRQFADAEFAWDGAPDEDQE